MKLKYINFIAIAVLIVSAFSFVQKDLKATGKSSSFKVIRVNGKIVFVKTGSGMKTGDVYFEGTPLKFSTMRDRAALISKIKGRFIITANVKGKPKVLPATTNIATRAPAVIINILDLKNYFSGNCVFIGDVEIKLGKEAFPLDEKHFFYVTFDYKGEEIAKKIDFRGNQLLIKKSELFSIDGQAIDFFEAKMTLVHLDGDLQKTIGIFTPIFPNENDLKEELKVLLAETKDESSEEYKIKSISSYINEFYGKPQNDNLLNWLEVNFNINNDSKVEFK